MTKKIKCYCKIKRILTEEELIILKDCFDLLENKFPNTSLIAELNNQCHCPHTFSYGFSHYCSNRSKINEHIKKNLSE